LHTKIILAIAVLIVGWLVWSSTNLAVLTYEGFYHGLTTPAPTGCQRYLVVYARGSGELDLAGAASNIITQTLAYWNNQQPGSAAQVNLNYPAASVLSVLLSTSLGIYHTSENIGLDNLTSFLDNQAARCPAEQFLLVGYSQGAEVTGDALQSDALLTPQAKFAIAKVLLLGDPVFNPYIAGARSQSTATANFPDPQGILGPRAGSYDPVYSGKIMDICAMDDPVCSAFPGTSIGPFLAPGTTAQEFRVVTYSWRHLQYAVSPYVDRGANWLTVGQP
jgi:Cutinase